MGSVCKGEEKWCARIGEEWTGTAGVRRGPWGEEESGVGSPWEWVLWEGVWRSGEGKSEGEGEW